MTLETSLRQPWEERQPSYGVKLLALAGAALLAIIALVSLFVLVFALIGVSRGSPRPGNDLIALLIGTVLLLASGFGLTRLAPLLRSTTAFTPSYGVVAPDTAGHPFEVRFQRVGWRRTLSGKGPLRFDPEACVIEGILMPSPLLQLAIVLLLTVLPLILFQIGLGLIPALIIAGLVGRKRITRSLPYHTLQNMHLQGSRAFFEIPDGQPRSIALVAASVDGERLYREVRQRFPTAG